MKIEAGKTKSLPIGWKVINLGAILYLKNGFAFKSNSYQEAGTPVIRISDIQDGIVTTKYSIKIKASEEFNDYLVHKDDMLIAMSGATTGKYGIYKQKELAYQNQRVGNFRLYSDDLINKKFIFFLLNSLKRKIEIKAYGGAQPNISGKNIESLKFSLPSLPEQHQIVAKIEKLFSELDNGIESLKKAREQLKTYRQAVLKYAFEGKLTNQVYNGNLPENWKIGKFEKLVSFSQGIQVPIKNQSTEKKGVVVRFLRIVDFTQGKETPRYISSCAKKYIVSKKDLSMVRYGASTGFICRGLEGAIANNLFRIIPVKYIDKGYLFYFFKSPQFNEILKSVLKGAAMPAISFGLLKSIKLPFSSLEQQQAIVSEIESRLSVCDQLEQTIEDSLNKAEALRQSILKKAFEGELTEDWREKHSELVTGENSAEKLLEKIKAEKDLSTTGRKKPRSKRAEKK